MCYRYNAVRVQRSKRVMRRGRLEAGGCSWKLVAGSGKRVYSGKKKTVSRKKTVSGKLETAAGDGERGEKKSAPVGHRSFLFYVRTHLCVVFPVRAHL